MPTAADILQALQAAGLQIIGVTILDAADPATWTFTPDTLTAEQRRAAIAVVQTSLQPPPPPPIAITKIAFLRLLQPAEYAAFVNGAATDSMLLYGKALLDAAFTMTPTEPSFLQMLAYCVAKGIFTAPRAAAIVAAMNGPEGA